MKVKMTMKIKRMTEVQIKILRKRKGRKKQN